MEHHSPEVAALRQASKLLEVHLSASQAETLLRFERLLLDRALPFGMVASSDASRLRERHLLDSLRAAAEVDDAAAAYDLGSGAGLPGIVIAIASPDLRVGLVESRLRRATFLESAVAELGLGNARVFVERAETLTATADMCFARAFAPLPEAWAAAERLLRPGGRLVYFAGVNTRLETPAGARILKTRESPVLESAGPLVIMGRL